MLVQNALFRTGGSVVMLSNRPADRRVAKFQLLHSVRICTVRSDLS